MQGSMWCHMSQEKVLDFWQLLPGGPFHWDAEPRGGVDGETGGQGKKTSVLESPRSLLSHPRGVVG